MTSRVDMADVKGSEGVRGNGHSEGEGARYFVQRTEMMELTTDIKNFKESLTRLKRVFSPDMEPNETLRVASHERLGEMLKILQKMLAKYPILQSNQLVEAAGSLIDLVKDFSPDDDLVDEKEFHDALERLALRFSNQVSEFLTGEIDLQSKLTSAPVDQPNDLPDNVSDHDSWTTDQVDACLMRHYQGVDHALKYAKMWAKYSKDILNYVEKRTNLELERARSLAKLAQATRPILTEESHLPFQSIYCTAMDQELEMCASTQEVCSLLQGYKFLEPLYARRIEHQKIRKNLKDRWTRELKQLQDTVSNLKKAKAMYMERNKEFERCREAVKIAEQGAEIGATGENKVERRKKLEDEAFQKLVETETGYKSCVTEANEKHRHLLAVKAEVLQNIRELIMQCDQTVKTVTVAYFQLQNSLVVNKPMQYQTLCERSRLYEPGSQFTEFVRSGLGEQPPSAKFSTGDPFNFEPYGVVDESFMYYDAPGGGGHRRSSVPVEVDDLNSGTYRFRGDRSGMKASGSGLLGGPIMAWAPSIGAIEPSDTDSGDSTKSRDTSPSDSPLISSRHLPLSEDIDNDHTDSTGNRGLRSSESNSHHTSATGATPRKTLALSLAAKTHHFRKLKTPSRCRECDSYVYFQGVDCSECGLSAHKKCLEVLALQCGHKRLPRKMQTFGVDLSQHLAETGSQIPPLVCKCVHEIDKRGTQVKGIYRVSGVKHKNDKLCQAFENAPDLVELGDIHPNVIANVLKQYLAQLPEPLITFNLYNEFIQVAKNHPSSSNNEGPSDDSAAIKELHDLVQTLPPTHYRTLGFLMHHILRVSKESEVNNMPASNLAIVLGPTLMRTSEGLASLSSLVDTDHQMRTVELLTLYANDIFGFPDSVLPKDYSKYTTPSPNRKLGDISGAISVKPKISKSHKSESSNDLISSQTERRIPDSHEDYPTLPGHVSERESTEDYISYEDEEDDVHDGETINWLPDDSTKTKKSPLLNRQSKVHKALNSKIQSNVTESNPRLMKQAITETVDNVPGSSSSSNVSSSSRRSTVPKGQPPHETSSSKLGKVTKKNSLDENLFSPSLPPHPTLTERLSGGDHRPIYSTGSRSTSATVLNISSKPLAMPNEVDELDGRRSSKSETGVLQSSTSPGTGRASLTIGIGGRSTDEHRRKFLSSDPTTSLPSNILNIEGNKVKIQVPAASIQYTSDTNVKSASFEKEEF